MAEKPIPGSYIDTQGMGAPADPNYKGPKEPREYKPATVRPVSYTHLTLPTSDLV